MPISGGAQKGKCSGDSGYFFECLILPISVRKVSSFRNYDQYLRSVKTLAFLTRNSVGKDGSDPFFSKIMRYQMSS